MANEYALTCEAVYTTLGEDVRMVHVGDDDISGAIVDKWIKNVQID